MDGAGRGAFSGEAECSVCKHFKKLWCTVEVNDKAEKKVLTGKDRCQSCWRRVLKVNTTPKADMPVAKRQRANPEHPLAVACAAAIHPKHFREDVAQMEAACTDVVDRAAADVLGQCVAGYKRLSEQLECVQQTVSEHTGVIGGLTEFAGNAVRAAGARQVDHLMMGAGVVNEWTFTCVQKIEALLDFPDKNMHSTYGDRLSNCLEYLRECPNPQASKVQNIVNFKCRGPTRYATQMYTPEYNEVVSRRALVACARHVAGMPCNGQCGFKYHFNTPVTLTTGSFQYLHKPFVPYV